MAFGERYAQAFWPLAAAPLAVAGLTVVAVAQHPSAVAVAALVVLAIDAALGEVLIWRALQSTWSSSRDTWWHRSERLRKVGELAVLFPILVAVGSLKAHDIEHGTWPEAFWFSARMFGGLFAFLFVCSLAVSVFNRYFNGPARWR